MEHTTRPIVVGSSALAVKYSEGVLMCTDTLASYGSLAKFKRVPRMAAIGENTLVGASGEYSDFQEIVRILRQKEEEDFTMHDGVRMTPGHYASYLSSVLYNKRNKLNPLYNSVLMGGVQKGETYLAYLDFYGTHVLGDYVTTGMGSHLAKPILAREWRADLSEQEAKALLEKCMRVLWYRDARASDRIQFAKVTQLGITFEDPYTMQSEWGLDSYRIYSLNPLFPY